MDRFERRLGSVFAVVLSIVLAWVPLQAAENQKNDSSKNSGNSAKESPLVKASREVGKQQTGSAKNYGNEDLSGDQKSKSKVYTNDDLSRMYGPPEETEPTTPVPASSPGAGTPEEELDPLALMEQEKNSRATRQDEIAKAEAALSAAESKLANLEKQLLAARNPFSARPDLSAEEQEYRLTGGETADQRFERTKQLVEEAKVEVTEAQTNLSRARSQ